MFIERREAKTDMKICSLRKGLGLEIADFILGCYCIGFCWWGVHFSWLPLHSVRVSKFFILAASPQPFPLLQSKQLQCAVI